MNPKLCRRISASLFFIANILLLVTNLQQTNLWQFIASILFITCSISLFLSATRHRFLFWGGIAVAVAYILTAVSNDGEGNIFAYISIFIGVFAGALIFRGGLQRETGKQMSLSSPLDLLDKYPLAAAGFIEGVCCILIFISAVYNGDARLMISSALWTVAHGFLIVSDEYLRDKLRTIQT